ncbi:unnamed protein product [Dovyalis caffra]|uniref:Uncharacterized protein n=1 Tax=Dovyalis caffra TaxID=77055 RepID=A0AAV1R2A6_9ROSI|nr:unnamed protein product [Dovyalis caffra]
MIRYRVMCKVGYDGHNLRGEDDDGGECRGDGNNEVFRSCSNRVYCSASKMIVGAILRKFFDCLEESRPRNKGRPYGPDMMKEKEPKKKAIKGRLKEELKVTHQSQAK